ncbi:MAG: four helix bundle protein [Bacteroidales bacterium]|nr:four helix bundle protein [Bacteroidales bacterium]
MAGAIQGKSRDFAIRIVNCYKYLTDQQKEWVLSKQLLRSGTSIGANTREGRNAQSRMDFLNKLNVALKEADETAYWLDIIHATGYIDDAMYESLETDCNELIALLVSIVKKLKEQ